jgi:hypothetical protein
LYRYTEEEEEKASEAEPEATAAATNDGDIVGAAVIEAQSSE